MPEEEIKKLKRKPTLRGNILTQFKIIENFSDNNDRNTTNTPIIDKTKQKMTNGFICCILFCNFMNFKPFIGE